VGRDDLAQKVEWVAVTIGEGLGFDVLSFDADDGSERLIEVKTTGLGKRFLCAVPGVGWVPATRIGNSSVVAKAARYASGLSLPATTGGTSDATGNHAVKKEEKAGMVHPVDKGCRSC
jgi:hypothetical protein